MMFYYTWCLRYNIFSAWFLDIRTSTCFNWIFKMVFLEILASVNELRGFSLRQSHKHKSHPFCFLSACVQSTLLCSEYLSTLCTCSFCRRSTLMSITSLTIIVLCKMDFRVFLEGLYKTVTFYLLTNATVTAIASQLIHQK